MNQPKPPSPEKPAVFFQLDRSRTRPYSRNEYIAKLLWFWVYHLLFRISPQPCYAWRRWLLTRFGARISATSRIRASVRITHPWLLTMGRYSTLGDHTHVYNLGPIAIGEHTVISQNVHLCAGTHDHKDPSFPLVRSEIHIGSGVWIAADAFIGPGVSLGDNCVVAARSVVTGDAPADALIGGNPGKVIRAQARA